jgi:hypothetical protein
VPNFLSFVPLGVVPASGVLQITRNVQDLGPATLAAVRHTQVFCVDAFGTPFIGTAQVEVLLDASL